MGDETNGEFSLDERGEFALRKASGLTKGFQPSCVIWIGKIWARAKKYHYFDPLS